MDRLQASSGPPDRRAIPPQDRPYHGVFLGGGSVLDELLSSDIQVDRIECGDACVPLVELWQVVRDDPGVASLPPAEDVPIPDPALS